MDLHQFTFERKGKKMLQGNIPHRSKRRLLRNLRLGTGIGANRKHA